MVNMNALKKRMVAAGHNQTSLERAAGIGNGAIGKWRTASPSIDNLSKVAEVLNCKIDELITNQRGENDG